MRTFLVLFLAACTPQFDVEQLELTLSGDHVGDSLTIGDFDQDGQDDLAIGAPHRDNGVVYVIYGPITSGGHIEEMADRTFSLPAVGPFGEGLATARTEEGEQLVITRVNGTYVYEASDRRAIDGTLHRYNQESEPYDLQFADVVGDEATDLIAVAPHTDEVHVFEGPLANEVATRWPDIEGGGVPITVADVDGDGRAEVFSILEEDGVWSIVHHDDVVASQEDPDAGIPVWASNTEIWDMRDLGDLDGDGASELGWWDGDVVVVAFDALSDNRRTETVPKSNGFRYLVHEYWSSPMPVGDIDGDGLGEWAEPGKHGVGKGIYLVDATGERSRFEIPQTSEIHAQAAGDLDGDGRPDIALGFTSEDFVHVYLTR